jgi:hypothetical protein
MSRSASFQHSFRGHQGRSFFLRVSIPTRRWREFSGAKFNRWRRI